MANFAVRLHRKKRLGQPYMGLAQFKHLLRMRCCRGRWNPLPVSGLPVGQQHPIRVQLCAHSLPVE